MRTLLKAAALAAVVSLLAMPMLQPMAAFAQEVAHTSSTAAGDTIVTIPLGNWTTNVLDIAGAILMTAVASLVAVAVRMLPDWLRPLVSTAVQAALTNFIRQGLAYAIQWVEGLDKDRTIDLNIGSAAVAVALRYVIEHAPAFLVNLAGGEEKIKDNIIALLGEFGIVLGPNVMPADVKIPCPTGIVSGRFSIPNRIPPNFLVSSSPALGPRGESRGSMASPCHSASGALTWWPSGNCNCGEPQGPVPVDDRR